MGEGFEVPTTLRAQQEQEQKQEQNQEPEQEQEHDTSRVAVEINIPPIVTILSELLLGGFPFIRLILGGWGRDYSPKFQGIDETGCAIALLQELSPHPEPPTRPQQLSC